MENLISREAIGGSFSIGIAAPESFPKIKVSPWASPKTKKAYKNIYAGVAGVIKLITQFAGLFSSRRRALVHLTILSVIAATVLGSAAGSQPATLNMLSAGEGYGGIVDQTTVATAVADIASRTDLAVSSDATAKATTVNSQIALPTADDEHLSKRQVVATAGPVNKGIAKYTVAGGDTLSAIASKFNVTTSTVRWANSLTDDMVRPGQTLDIPPISGVVHTVAASDTAESLAVKYGSNAAQIISFNDAEVKGLQAGQKIVIPDGVKPAAVKPAVAPAPLKASPALTRFAFRGNGYSYGYCTYFVAGRRAIPSNWGNASSWYYNARFSGFGTGTTPMPGAIAWDPNSWGAGHVAYVESVSGGMVTISEMNYYGNGGGWNRVSYRTVPASTFYYIY